MKFGPVVTEISRFIIATAMACACFIAIYLVCYFLGLKTLDPWLLAGFSMALGARRFIFSSPSLISFIENKENTLYTVILIFFQVYTFLAFGAVFLATTLLANFNRYKINPVVDVFLALLVPTLMVTYLVILQKKKNPANEDKT